MPGQVKTYGFTLVEALVVVVIIAILVSLAIGVVGWLTIRAEADEVKTELRVIMTSIQAFYEEKGSYPDDATTAPPLGDQLKTVPDALKRLASLSKTAFEGSGDLKDRYGNKIDYFRERGAGGTPLLRSRGADGIAGTKDDIWSDGLKHN
jgi:prepilin-type N-terminal cleavage/methylation domain-containing protein